MCLYSEGMGGVAWQMAYFIVVGEVDKPGNKVTLQRNTNRV